jgi:hypothetical protein
LESGRVAIQPQHLRENFRRRPGEGFGRAGVSGC